MESVARGEGRGATIGHPLLKLALLGAGSVVLYGCGLALRYPLAEGLLHPRYTWARLASPSLPSLLLHAGVYAALTVLYVLAHRLALQLGKAQDRGHNEQSDGKIASGEWRVATADSASFRLY